jgi:hypothetical protein
MTIPSYEMRSLRKEDLSLYLYIKDVVLRPFQETEENVQLQLMPELCDVDSYVYQYVSDLEPSPTERGRGWVYFNPPSGTLSCQPYTTVSGRNGDGVSAYGTPEQTDQIIVYENGVAVDWQEYMIDYIDGRIITERKLTNPTVDFTWNYVSVVDEWAAIEAADPPVIVIDMHGTDKAGYQLGGGKMSTRKVDIHVFASDPAERNDIVETLYDGLFNRRCPLLNFPTGSVLDYDGTFYGRKTAGDKALELGIDINSEEYINKLTFLFDREQALHVSSLFFDSVTARHVNLPLIMTRGTDEVMLSDLNAYRSKVSFDMFTYDDRNTGRIY